MFNNFIDKLKIMLLNPKDTFLLATTKLRVRKVRLAMTLVVSGLLFTVLIFGSLLGRGTISSLEKFTKEGFLQRFISSASEVNQGTLTNQAYLDKATTIQKARLAAQVAEAKRLGISFDPAAESKPVSDMSDTGGSGKQLDITNAAAQQAIRELAPTSLVDTLKKATESYGAKAIVPAFSFMNTVSGNVSFEINPIISGHEQKKNTTIQTTTNTDSLSQLQDKLSAYDDILLKPFLLEGVSLEAKSGEPLPIMAPTDAVENMLGLKSLPSNAKPKDKLSRLGELREKAKDLKFDLCYRNAAAIELRDTATQQAEDIAAHKGDNTYAMPAVIYSVPSKPCSAVGIAKDARSPEDKNQAIKEQQFKEKFGQQSPVTQIIPVRIAGLIPSTEGASQASGVEGLFSSFFTSTLGGGWYLSYQAAQQQPVLKSLMDDKVRQVAGSTSAFVEFKNRNTQKTFTQKHGCDLNSDPTSCGTDKFYLQSFGNPLASLYEVSGTIVGYAELAIVIIALLSAIVMMGTIGKIIADSRKETSVFRAVGAKRMDIAQIYILYSIILATLAYLVALILGIIIAIYMQIAYSVNLGAQAVLVFNSRNLHQSFGLIMFSIPDLLLIYIFVLFVALISAAFPLLMNMRRSPIKDMRDE